MAAQNSKTPTVLIVLDGWGHREATENNAIHHARTPVWDKLWAQAPHTLVSGSGLDVGLPDGQMGNSEVGHMSLGSGRIVYQNMTRIDAAIEDKSFFANPAYIAAIDKAIANGKAVHVMGLLSPGGVHSHENHIFAITQMAVERGAKDLYVHAFLDGRDTAPKSAQASISALQEHLAALGTGRIATVIGRYFAMDRDNRWERVETAYRLLTEGEAEFSAADAIQAIEQSYQREQTDEFVAATRIGERAPISDGDAVIFMNFRSDRAREITRAFVDRDFDGFQRQQHPALADFVMTTEYAADINASCAYAPEHLHNVLGEYLEKNNKTQLRIAETEKYAHVTFFFSGGREAPFKGEDRELIASPKVATYDLQPEMSAPELTDKLTAAITSGKYDCIICNYANGDMVGHTGVFDAAVRACEAVDECLGRVVAAVKESGGHCLITADHGNVEQMQDEHSGQPHTAHTTELVPLVYVGSADVAFKTGHSTLQHARLCDVAPTLLQLMQLPQPKEMTGDAMLSGLADNVNAAAP